MLTTTIVYVIAVLAAFVVSRVEGSTYYSASTSNAYTWARSYPQSCSCQQDGVTTSTCTYYACNCACDLTAGVCDFNCCCDPDCSSSQITRFTSLDKCDWEGDFTSTEELCYSSLDLEKVNPRPPLGGQATSQGAVGQALCIYKSNVYEGGNYYTDTSMQSYTVFTTTTGQKSYDYNDAESTTFTTTTYYDQNKTMSAFYLLGSTYFTAKSGYFQLPVADFSGQCADSTITFENDIDSRQCLRTYTTQTKFEDSCRSEQEYVKYVDQLWIAKSADLAASGTATSSNTVKVTITAVNYVDYSNGEVTDITSTWSTNSCKTEVVSPTDYKTSSATRYACSISTNLKRDFANYNVFCRGMVVGVDYVVAHSTDATGDISSVTATVTVSDVPYASTVVTVSNTYSVSFSSASTSSVSSTNGNIVARARSGNPGYLVGKPVIAGYVSSSIINELTEGLTIPSAISPFSDTDVYRAPGICPNNTDNMGTTSVLFGYDVSTGCSLSLTKAQLKAMCCTGLTTCSATYSSPYTGPTGLPRILNSSLTPSNVYLGIYGNADPLDTSQWTGLTKVSNTLTRSWSDTTGTCYNMPTGLKYEFLYTWSGEKANPQNKIVATASTVVVSDVVWRSTYENNSTVAVQSIPFQVTATFVNKANAALIGYTPPAPPVLFSVPYDIFYPFDISSAAAPTVSTPLVLSLVATTLCIFTAFSM